LCGPATTRTGRAKAAAAKDEAASFYLPFDGEQPGECQLAARHFKGGSPLWAFRDSAVEHSFRSWHAGELAKVGQGVNMVGFGCGSAHLCTLRAQPAVWV